MIYWYNKVQSFAAERRPKRLIGLMRTMEAMKIRIYMVLEYLYELGLRMKPVQDAVISIKISIISFVDNITARL